MGFSHYWVILCMAFLLWTPSCGSEVISTAHFYIDEPPDISPSILEELLLAAEKARQEITDKVARPFDKPTRVVVCLTPEEFHHRTNFNSEHILASATAGLNLIHINFKQMSEFPTSQFHKTMLHEYAHIYLGNMCDGALPLWLNEGIAMHMSSDWSVNDMMRFALARLAGKHIPLSEIEAGFPQEENRMRLAYLQSHSIVAWILKERYGGASVFALVDDLTHPTRGAELIALYWNRMIRNGLESSWLKANRRWMRNLIFIISSQTFLLFLMIMLALLAFYLKRRRRLPILEEWEEEENLYSSLPDNESYYRDDDQYEDRL